MSNALATSRPSGRPWRTRSAGLLYILGGGGLASLSLVLLGVFLTGGMNAHQPHACASLQCLHGTAVAPDGRRHCAENPPTDLVLSDAAWHNRHALGFSSGILGLVCAVATMVIGGRWLFGGEPRHPGSRSRAALAVAAPLGALAGPILLRALAWPLGFFSF